MNVPDQSAIERAVAEALVNIKITFDAEKERARLEAEAETERVRLEAETEKERAVKEVRLEAKAEKERAVKEVRLEAEAEKERAVKEVRLEAKAEKERAVKEVRLEAEADKNRAVTETIEMVLKSERHLRTEKSLRGVGGKMDMNGFSVHVRNTRRHIELELIRRFLQKLCSYCGSGDSSRRQ
jgi:hypothetical protein